jgi:spore coat protein U-like protein
VTPIIECDPRATENGFVVKANHDSYRAAGRESHATILNIGSDTVKKILLPLAIASMLSAGSALAVSTPPASFNVAVTLTSACTVSTPTALTFTYTSMQGGAASPTGGGAFNVTCTNSLPYTVALDAAAGTFAAVNLNYTLTLSGASGTGTGLAQPFTIGGSIPGNQAGTCTGASCSDTSARTITVSY